MILGSKQVMQVLVYQIFLTDHSLPVPFPARLPLVDHPVARLLRFRLSVDIAGHLVSLLRLNWCNYLFLMNL